MGWDDDWQEAKRQREEEDYDRWWAQREAERDADAGRYHRPTFSGDAWDTYERVWEDRDRDNRAWESSRRTREQDQEDDRGAVSDSWWGDTSDRFDGVGTLSRSEGVSSSAIGTSTSAQADDTWAALAVTGILMLVTVGKLGILGVIACVLGWQIFLVVGWVIGATLHRLIR